MGVQFLFACAVHSFTRVCYAHVKEVNTVLWADAEARGACLLGVVARGRVALRTAHGRLGVLLCCEPPVALLVAFSNGPGDDRLCLSHQLVSRGLDLSHLVRPLLHLASGGGGARLGLLKLLQRAIEGCVNSCVRRQFLL